MCSTIMCKDGYGIRSPEIFPYGRGSNNNKINK